MTQTNIELLKAWYIFSFSLGCWTCLTLLISRYGDGAVKKTILSFILLLLVPPANEYIHLIMAQPPQWLLILSQKLTWCYGPILVALIRHSLLRPTSYLSYSLQALPFTFFYLNDYFNLQLVSLHALVFLLCAHVFSYLIYSAYLLRTEKSRLLKLTTQFKNSTYYWLLYLVLNVVIIMLFDVGIYIGILFGHFPTTSTLTTVASFIAIFSNTIALFSIYQPKVFFHETPLTDNTSASEKNNLRSLELSPEAAKELDEKLQLLVINHKPHLDEDISLAKLASLLGVTGHQLSELLNVHKSTNFYDYLNTLRHQESLQLLAQHKSTLSVTDIAYRSGFNNRNTFYKVFKEKTGLTPNQYKKSIGS
jgi:AraC-like DNA-binding protein